MWILLSVLAGVSLGVRNLLSKKSADNLPELVSTWFLFAFSLPVVLLGFFFQPFLVTDSLFWVYIVGRLILDSLAALAFYKALKLKSVSVVIPLLALQPLFTLCTAFLIIHQVPSSIGILATILVVVGLGCMYFSEMKVDAADDFLKSALYVLVTIVAYAFLEPMHVKAISYSNLTTYLVVSQSTIAGVLLGAVFYWHRADFFRVFSTKSVLAVNSCMGVFLGLEVSSMFLAFTLAKNVAYVISISSLHIIISILGAVFFFKEKVGWKKVVAIGLLTVASVLFAYA